MVFLLFIAEYFNDLDKEADALIMGSKAPSTWTKYNASFRRFEIWTARLKLKSLPATPETVIRFLADLSREKRSVNVISTAFCAISSKHILNGFENPCKDARVKALCEGAKRKFFRPQRQCKPRTAQILNDIVEKKLGKRLKDGSLRDWRTVWLAVISFRCCARYDDIARLRIQDFTFRNEFMLVHFKSRKNDQKGEGHTAEVTRSSAGTCVIDISKRYFKKLRREGSKETDFALPRMDRLVNGRFKTYFSQAASHNSCRLPFLSVLSDVGVDPGGYGLHSGKVGGVIALRNGGLSWRTLCDYVGWAPKSVMPERYAKAARKPSEKIGKLLSL